MRNANAKGVWRMHLDQGSWPVSVLVGQEFELQADSINTFNRHVNIF